jgi:predicted RNA-binding protein (virulence factor B family)
MRLNFNIWCCIYTGKKMVQIGRINTLTVTGIQSYGVHLDGGEAGDILLRNKFVPGKCHPGDEVEVFVYVDRENHLQATTRTPSVMVGQFASLRVVASTSSGAYLDWGLENDLFVPKSEQQDNMKESDSYVVFVFLSERTNRITASSKLVKFLSPQPPIYKEGEEVDLLIYEKTAMGYGALVNRAHAGMVYKNEVFQQQSGYQRVDDISETILNIIKEKGGSVAVTDKSPPDDIYALFGVSKKVFKKAIGALYKKRLVALDKTGIKLV